MLIRQMTAFDIDRVYEITCRSFDESYVKEAFFLFIKEWPSGQLVAMGINGEVIGFISGTRTASNKVTVSLFGIDPAYRDKGIGRRLLDEFKVRTMIDGKQYIELEVRTTNLRAISLYKRKGFSVTGYLENFYNDGGNAIRMMCRISVNS